MEIKETFYYVPIEQCEEFREDFNSLGIGDLNNDFRYSGAGNCKVRLSHVDEDIRNNNVWSARTFLFWFVKDIDRILCELAMSKYK